MNQLLALVRRVLLVAVVALFASGCAASSTVTAAPAPAPTPAAAVGAVAAPAPFSATADTLARAKLQVEDATSFQFEIFSVIEADFFEIGDRSIPLVTGGVNGNRTQSQTDVASFMGPFAAITGASTDELEVQLVTDGDVLYLSSGLFGAAAGNGMLPGTGSAWADELAGGWGRIDTAALAGEFTPLSELGLGAQSDPTEVLDILTAAGEVQDAGRGEIRGVETNIAIASVPILELIDYVAPGEDLMTFEDIALDAIVASIEVHIDDDDQLRRVEFTVDAAAAFGDDTSGLADMFDLWHRVDYFAFGEDIAIEIPTGAVDITADVQAMLDAEG